MLVALTSKGVHNMRMIWHTRQFWVASYFRECVAVTRFYVDHAH